MPEQYTVFLIDGCFLDTCDPGVDSLRFDAVDADHLKGLLELAMANGFDMVIRRASDAGDETPEVTKSES